MLRTWLYRWGPAVLMMALIFSLSARASADLPDFGIWDYVLKKVAHMVGYGLLALAYWQGLSLQHGRRWPAWGLAICYAITDEIHQNFVPGRHPSPVDILLFDNLGAILGLILWIPLSRLIRRRQS